MRISVNKENLVQTLTTNLTEHKQIYLEAVEGYHIKLQEYLQGKLNESKGDGFLNVLFSNYDIKKPISYAGSYVTALEMLALADTESVELSVEDFKSFVQDKWNWNRDFFVTNNAYSSTSRGKAYRLAEPGEEF